MLYKCLRANRHGAVLASAALLVFFGVIFYQDHPGKAGVIMLLAMVVLAAHLLVGHLLNEARTQALEKALKPVKPEQA